MAYTIAQFVELLHDAQSYPCSLVCNDASRSNAMFLRDQIIARSEKLFCPERRAAVDIWEIYRRDEGYHAIRIQDCAALELHLRVPIAQCRPDPRCRFVYDDAPGEARVLFASDLWTDLLVRFIQAPHSRERLNITQNMMFELLTYHQVMTPFLEHLLPYGRQHHRRDLYGPGFRSTSRLHLADRGLITEKLGRSGTQLEFCHTLQAPELSGDRQNPWSVRSCSVYHCFDLDSERAVWLIVKGNELMKEIVTTGIRRQEVEAIEPERPLNVALRSSLAVHIEICKWSTENWSSYLQSLEALLQDKTRRTLSTKVDRARTNSLTRYPALTEQQFSNSGLEQGDVSAEKSPRNIFTREFWRRPKSISEQPPDSADWSPAENTEEVSFRDLQSTHYIEEKANDAAMVLKFNAEGLTRLHDEYSALLEPGVCASSMFDYSKEDVRRFSRTISSLRADLEVQQARAQALVRVVQERKNLLNDIVQFRNMQAAQSSATKMAILTKEMHEIAQKTQVETVSMRIITVVTLFFLPGTFISTLMSTPVVTFQAGDGNIGDRTIGIGALEFYVAVSVPLMAFTFATWYAVYLWERKKEKQRHVSFLARFECGNEA